MVPLRMTLESKVLVGAFNPSEKCCQIGNLPQIGFFKKSFKPLPRVQFGDPHVQPSKIHPQADTQRTR